MWPAGNLTGLRFQFQRYFVIVGIVIDFGFVLGKISAILGRISGIIVLGRLLSILWRPAVPLWSILGRLGRLGPS